MPRSLQDLAMTGPIAKKSSIIKVRLQPECGLQTRFLVNDIDRDVFSVALSNGLDDSANFLDSTGDSGKVNE